MSLQTQAMLVTLSISCWTARVQDKKVSAEVDANHNARDAGKYNKLLVDKAYLDPLVAYAGSIRAYHYRMTLPWMDNGARLLPSKLFMEYRSEIANMKGAYATLVSTFITEYENKLKQDARVRLGTLYDPKDYPESWELRDKFGVDVQITPVPSGSDFRVDVGDAEREHIARDISERVAERERAATLDAWQRIRSVVGLIEQRLSVPKVRVFDSLIDNVHDLVRILPGLNVANDPHMDTVCSKMIESLLVDPSRLRSSQRLCAEIAAKARSILELIPAA